MSHNQSSINTTCGTNGTLLSNGTITNISCNSDASTPREQSMLQLSLEARITLICIYSVIFLLGMLGNSLVCYVIGKKKKCTGGDVFMISLAAADLLASIFVPILVITDLTTNDVKWYFGAAMCKILPSVSPLTLAVSSWSLVLIAADRYKIIISPMKPRISGCYKILGILFTWSLAIGITLPYTLSQELIFGEYCLDAGLFMTRKERNVYAVLWIVGGWILPLFIISISYGLCIQKLKQGKLKEGNESMKKRNEQNRRVVKMFMIIVCIFFVFTMPYSTFYVATNFMLTYRRAEVDRNLIWVLNYSLFVLTNINSCINPFIYAKMHQEINKFVLKAWKKICCGASLHRGPTNDARKKSYAVSQTDSSVLSRGEVATARRPLDQTFDNPVFDNKD